MRPHLCCALFAAVVAAAILLTPVAPLGAQVPRVLPPDERPDDGRLGPLRLEKGDFPLGVPKSAEAWQQKEARVRRIMQVSLGLWPMPTKTPLKPVVHGKRDLGDYTIEKVYCESLPGFYLTGSLYRPKQVSGKRPAVLSPHGHFPGGRFQDYGREHVRRQIVRGEERFEDGGRSFMQSRCVQLARMGCVVFHYDMIGYADSVQIPQEVAHRFSRTRHKIDAPPKRGLYSAAAELRLQNIMGLHTYNSIRALDFLTSLPDVDPERIAVTGGSGGGTQTFMLCALDDRPLVAIPVVIVSTTRQGGCTCENIPYLRVGTNNIEFTALHAPKPLLLISADDATRSMPERGFPELKQLYRLLGTEKHVEHAALLHFPHNYNYVSRAVAYRFINRHLKLGLEEPILERPYRRLTEAELTVWDEQHPRPEGGPEFEQRLLDWLTQDAARQMADLKPHDGPSLARYRKIVGGALDVLVRPPQFAVAPELKTVRTLQRETCRETRGLLRYHTGDDHQAELPVILLAPQGEARQTVVWVSASGKAGLYNADGSLQPPVARLLKQGAQVIGVDLLGQGELTAGNKPFGNRWIENEYAHAGWTYCYNLPLFSHRVQDILATIALARQQNADRPVSLIGLSGAGPLAATAAAVAGDALSKVAVETGGFRFAQVADLYDPSFLPGGAKYGDLPGLLALAAPARLWLAGEGEHPPEFVAAAYQAAGNQDQITLFAGEQKDAPQAAVKWLLAD